MKKKLLSLALALALCLGLAVPAAAAATITEIVSPETYESFLQGYRFLIQGFHDDITWHGSPSKGYGAFDTTGKVIVAPGTYAHVTDFSDGVAWGERGYVWYAVDKTGRELFALEGKSTDWATPGDFHDGLARVYLKETKMYGYVDKTGRIAIPIEHNSKAGDFSDGLAVVYDSANAFYGYMDKTGTVVIPMQYSDAREFVNGFAVVKLGSRWTVIDTTGKELISQESNYPTGFYAAWPNDISTEVVRVNGSNGADFVNRAGQVVSGGYESTGAFVDGMAMVMKGGKYGFVNEAGALVIPCTLGGTSVFRDGYASVSIDSDGTQNIIDKTGKVTATIPYNGGFSNAGNGCFRMGSRETGKWRYGFIDYTGREIVPYKYAEVKDFSGGVAAVKNFDNKWGFVDTTGAEIVPCQYSNVEYTDEAGIFAVGSYHDNEGWRVLKASGWSAPAAVPSAPMIAYASTQPVSIDGNAVELQAYALKDAKGNLTNYVKLRDVAYVLNGSAAQFNVGWDGNVNIVTGSAYAANGSEMSTPFSGDRTYTTPTAATNINGAAAGLAAIVLTDDNGGGHTYYQLRDLGRALGFNVGWSADRGIFIETDKPYTDTN